MTETTIELSTLPPSTNNLFFNRGRARAPTKEYTAWREQAGLELMVARPRRVPGRVVIVMTFGRPDRRRRDVSNLLKPVEDALVRHGVIEDDSLVDDIRGRWSDQIVGVRVTVSEVE